METHAHCQQMYTCDECSRLFEKDHRSLVSASCNHNFCPPCLQKHLDESPVCRENHESTEASSCPHLFDTTYFVSEANHVTHGNEGSPSNEILQLESTNANLESVGICSTHNCVCHFRCMDHEAWICGVCGVLLHKECQTLLVKAALEEMKLKVSRDVRETLQREAAQNHLALEIKKVLHGKSEYLKKQIMDLPLHDKIIALKSCETSISSLSEIRNDASQYCEILNQINSSILESRNSNELSKCSTNLKNIEERMTKDMGENVVHRLCHPNLIKEDVLAWCENKPVFALRRLKEGVTQFGKLEIKGNRSFIHHFQNKRPEGNPMLISFRELLLLFKGSLEFPKKAFLQVSDKSSVVGDMVVGTDGYGHDSVNFLLLCAGVKGRSYAGTSAKFCYKRGVIRVGPSEVVSNATSVGGDLGASVQEDLEEGAKKNLSGFFKFSIWAKNTSEELMVNKFGNLEEGFEVLKELSARKRKRKMYFIKSCGLVI